VLVIDAAVPWIPGTDQPPESAYVAVMDADPIRTRIIRFTRDLGSVAIRCSASRRSHRRSRSSSARKIRRASHNATPSGPSVRASVPACARARASGFDGDADRCALALARDRRDAVRRLHRVRRSATAQFVCGTTCARIDRFVLRQPRNERRLAPGAALAASSQRPDRDVVAITATVSTCTLRASAMWAGAHYGAPFLTIVYQNRSYSTGTLRVKSTYPDSLPPKRATTGYFDPPVDFAREAEAAGAYGENVRDPAKSGPRCSVSAQYP